MADETGVAEGSHGHSIFLCSKNKKGKQRVKGRVSKQKLLKGKNVTVLGTFAVLF